MTTALFVASLLVLSYFVLLNGGYLITTMLSVRALRQHAQRSRARDVAHLLTSGAPPITLLAPAYNEEATCVEATTALLSLVYPEYEVLVINDGSRDATLARMREAFDLVPAPRAPTAGLPTATVRETYRSRRRPNLWVIDKENGGKADALNTGINYCGTGLFCAMDADTLLERDALARVVRPFLEDARTVAVGGIIRIVNDSQVRVGMVEQVLLPRRWLPRFQVLEYLRAFLAGRVGWDVLDAMLIISGAFGLFRRSLAVELGGYATDTVGEDMELVVRMHRHCREKGLDYRVTFIPDPVAWTEAPETLRVLGRQRDRWQRGLMQVLWRHRVMLLNPRYGRVGMLAFPYFFFLEGLGPLIELLGYLVFALALLTGTWSPLFVVAFFAVAFVFGAALSLAAIGLEELSFRRYDRWRDLARLIGVAMLEPFGYRQLSTWWRVKGVISALRGVKGWGAMERRGFRTTTVALLLAGAVLSPTAALAQDTTHWSARLVYGREQFSTVPPVWTDWETWEAAVARRFAAGSLSAGLLRAIRFGDEDVAAVVDVYRTLHRGAYVNVRTQLSPGAVVIAQADVAAELFQAVGGGWEPSVGVRRMSFGSAEVTGASAALAKYVGPWYLRVRGSYHWQHGLAFGDGGAAASALLRRYLGTDGQVEASGGVGSEPVTLADASRRTTAEVRHTSFLLLGAQMYFFRNVGLTGSATYGTFEGAPDRTGLSAGLLLRW